jgi:hypothetical protein
MLLRDREDRRKKQTWEWVVSINNKESRLRCSYFGLLLAPPRPKEITESDSSWLLVVAIFVRADGLSLCVDAVDADADADADDGEQDKFDGDEEIVNRMLI